MLTFLTIILSWFVLNWATAALAAAYDRLPQVKLVRRVVLLWYIPMSLLFVAIAVRSSEDMDVFIEELEAAWDDPTYTPFQDESYL